MKKYEKSIIGLIAIVVIASVAMLSGCLKEPPESIPTSTPVATPTPTPTPISTPTNSPTPPKERVTAPTFHHLVVHIA